MLKRIKSNINLTKASLYLEKINTGKYNQKVKAYEKLKKIDITNDIGIRIIENATYKYDEEFNDMHINSMLLLLCMEKYYPEYTDAILENFNDYDTETKLDLLAYLSSSDSIDAILAWKYIILNVYEPEDNKIPIGTLSNNKENYDILYPDLYYAFKSDNKKYSLIILLNNFINLGVVPIDDLKKYKKDLIKHILMPLEELSKFKLSAKEDYMTNKTYLGLRYVVESTLNIEYYCSNTKTKALLDKLFKHKDNQLKLFVLESYIKKKKSIKKLNLNPIAKDLRSRYLLYNLLSFYNKADLMPKKYNDDKLIGESELYNIFANNYNYEKEPISMKFYKQIERNGNKYNLYKFKAKKDYNEIVLDYATDYLMINNHLDKYLSDVYENYLGICPSVSDNDPLIIDTDITRNYEVFDKDRVDEIIDSFFKKETPTIEENIPVEETIEEQPHHSKLNKVFNVNNLFIFQLLLIVALMVILVLYVNGINVFNIKIDESKSQVKVYKKSNINVLENYNEINGHNIYNVDDGVYYVLVYKKNDLNEYYTYFKTLLENGYRIFYVDLNKEENLFLYEPNNLGIVIKKNRFIKVNGKDFEYYVDGKDNILKELDTETNAVIQAKIEKELKEKEAKEKAEKVENKEN